MKRWFLLVTLTVALPVVALACGDDEKAPSGATPTSTIDSGKTNPTSTTTNPTPTSTSTTPSDGGAEAGKRTGCLDRPPSDPRSEVERPDRLPCILIPPGLTL